MPPEISDADLKALNDAKAERDTLKAENEKLKAAAPKTEPKPDPKPDDKKTTTDEEELRVKAQKDKEASEAQATQARRMEGAVKFNMKVGEFVKTNKEILPEEMEQILKTANTEKYDSEVERANAVRVAMIQSFFGVQKNVDELHANQRKALESYLGLTKKAKEEKAADVFENIFEPAFETLVKLKKAEELAKGAAGFATSSTGENKYKEKLVKASRQTYLGEKGT